MMADSISIAVLEDTKAQDISARIISGPPASMYYIANFITTSEEASLLSSIYSAPLPQWRQLSHRRLQSLPSPLTKQNVLLDAPLPKWLQWPAQRITELRTRREIRTASGSDAISDTSHPESGGRRETLFDASPHKAPNHCLVNEYEPGQGIMPHEDGPAYHPITATVSLRGHTVLDVTLKTARDQAAVGDEQESSTSKGGSTEQAWRILCEPRSLLITTDDAYSCTLHAIEGVDSDENIGAPHQIECNGSLGEAEIGVANWNLLGDQEGWIKDGGTRKRETRISLTYRDVQKVKSLKAFGRLGQFGQ